MIPFRLKQFHTSKGTVRLQRAVPGFCFTEGNIAMHSSVPVSSATLSRTSTIFSLRRWLSPARLFRVSLLRNPPDRPP